MSFARIVRRLLVAGIVSTCLAGSSFAQDEESVSLSAQDKLTTLAQQPRWRDLDIYQRSITKSSFERLLYNYYSTDKAFCSYLEINPESATVYQDKERKVPLWTLEFSLPLSKRKDVKPFFSPGVLGELKGIDPKKPLEGVIIALDPGHIGGEWSNVEERYFKIGKDPAVEEAHLNMVTCELLAKNLEQAGARVVWSKRGEEPATALRPNDLKPEAIAYSLRKNPKLSNYIGKPQALKALQWSSEILFYRVAEIQARADKLNQDLKPDLTICIHYNATGWKNPSRPVLYSYNNLLVFVNGNYLANEVIYDDIKFGLMKKLLERSIGTEISIGDAIGRRMKDHWPQWKAGSFGKAGKAVGTTGYVWSRNLLANRLFNGPVVFVEGPFMNNKDVYPRLIEGDYEGIRTIRGKEYRSVYREYADIVAAGIIDYYAKKYDLPADEVWSPLSKGNLPPLPTDDGAIDEVPESSDTSPLMNLDVPPNDSKK